MLVIHRLLCSGSVSISLQQRLALSRVELGPMLVLCSARIRRRGLLSCQRILGPIGGLWHAPVKLAVYLFRMIINRIVMLLENLPVPNG